MADQVTTTFAPIAATAVVASAGGGTLAKALSDIVVWHSSIACSCTPPAGIHDAFEIIFTPCVVLGALIFHFLFLKLKGPST